MLKLSATGKMPCRSWSLQALATCPASKAKDGGLVDACKGCYATTGNYRFPNVKAPRLSNQLDWKRDDWTNEMIAELDNDRYFRWFDSGDISDYGQFCEICEIARDCPDIKFWLPTRELAVVQSAYHKIPSNLVVRYSTPMINALSRRDNSTMVASSLAIIPDSCSVCPATVNDDHTCNGNNCRNCWLPGHIAYLKH